MPHTSQIGSFVFLFMAQETLFSDGWVDSAQSIVCSPLWTDVRARRQAVTRVGQV